MTKKFLGNYKELQDKILASGNKGEWKELCNSQKQFKAENGAILNWWETSKTLQFQGSEDTKKLLESSFDSSISQALLHSNQVDQKPNVKTKIFVVHGHDQTSLEQLELVLRRLSLDPYILQNNDGGSKTLIEALEKQIYSEAAFGIVLMTPDDYGYPKDKLNDERQPRARQNVILELGMVMASLGRDKIVILKKGNLEAPSDVNGVIYLEFNDHVKEIAVKLANRIKSSGIDVPERLIAQAGI